MGNSRSKKGTRAGDEALEPLITVPKSTKDHRRDKTFRIGLSFGKGDLSAEGHFQMGYVSKTKKVYSKLVNEDEVGCGSEQLRSVSEPVDIPARKVTFQEEPDVRVIEDQVEDEAE